MTTIHLDELELLYHTAERESSPQEASATFLEHSAQIIKSSKKHFSFPKLANIARFSELKTLMILFAIVFSAFFFFTNAQLVFATLSDTFSAEPSSTPALIQLESEHHSAQTQEVQQEKLAALEEKFAQIQQQQRSEKDLAVSLQSFLDQKQETHTLNFNTLPPTNRLIIPDLNINVPLVDVPVKGGDDFAEGNFDEELMQGVVKYPTTATPGAQGNSLLFGHSSTERWKKNPYGIVFRNLPKLQSGQQFQIVWDGQLTTYEMVERKVVLPKEVADYYHEFQDKGESFVTLMGCYPIGSDAKRMMVVAKKVN